MEPIGPKLLKLDLEVNKTKDKLAELKKSQAASVKSLYAFHSNLMTKLADIKEELDSKIMKLETKVGESLTIYEERLLRGL